MFRHLKLYVVMVVMLAIGGGLSLAENASPPGRVDAVLACDVTDEGLKVNFSETTLSSKGFSANPGDACLPILANYPVPFRSVSPLVAKMGNGGPAPTTPEDLVWTFFGPKNEVEAVVGCAVVDGLLTTVFVDNQGPPYLPKEDERCGETLSKVELVGFGTFSVKKRPIPAALRGEVVGVPGGQTMVWTLNRHDEINVVGCDLIDGVLETRFVDSGDGTLYTPEDERCLDTLSILDGEGFKASNPVAAIQSGADTTIDECLIWIIDGANVSS